MTITRLPRWRVGASFVALAGALALSLTLPIPALPDGGRTAVLHEVRARLPGWAVERLERSWEGAYTVITVCAGREVGFQFVPGHGLPAGNAWIQPNDAFSRERLTHVSDHWRYLVWYADPAIMSSLSCADEIAGGHRSRLNEGGYD